MSQPAPLRFAVMIPGLVLKAWQVECIRRLISSGYAIPVLLIQDESSTPPSFGSKLKKYLGRNGLYRAYERCVLRIPALELEAVDQLLAGVELIGCRARRVGRYSDYLPEEALQRLREVNPDFILRFAFNILKGEVLNIPRFGVWSFHHADEQVFRGGPAAFWEVFHRHHKIGVVLQRLNERIDSGHILKKGWYKVSKHSWPETLNRVLTMSAGWPAQLCNDILIRGFDPATIPASDTKAIMNRLPNNGQMLVFMCKAAVSRMQFYFQTYLRVEEWNIGVIDKPVNQVLSEGIIEEPRWLFRTGPAWFAADPAVLTSEAGVDYLLFEHFNQRINKAEIAIARLGQNDEGIEFRTLITASHHIAFPRIVEIDGTQCFMAETSLGGSQQAYRLNTATRPLITEEITLMPGIPAIDASMLHYQDRWYIFCTLRSTDSNTCLHIYHSEGPAGPWLPHDMNPVKTDISSARMAGPLFMLGSSIIRPSQDSAPCYGSRIKLQRIKELSPRNYEEENFGEINPAKNWKYNRGLHTIDGNDRITVIDAKRYQFSLLPLIKRLFD